MQDAGSISLRPAPGMPNNDGQIRYQTFRVDAIYEMIPEMDYYFFYNLSGENLFILFHNYDRMTKIFHNLNTQNNP